METTKGTNIIIIITILIILLVTIIIVFFFSKLISNKRDNQNKRIYCALVHITFYVLL